MVSKYAPSRKGLIRKNNNSMVWHKEEDYHLIEDNRNEKMQKAVIRQNYKTHPTSDFAAVVVKWWLFAALLRL